MTKLKADIQRMLDQARQAPTVPQCLAIKGDVGWQTIEVTQMRDGRIILALEQPFEQPTLMDWRRVLACWPEPVPDAGNVVSMKYKHGRLYRSVLRWPRPAVTA